MRESDFLPFAYREESGDVPWHGKPPYATLLVSNPVFLTLDGTQPPLEWNHDA